MAPRTIRMLIEEQELLCSNAEMSVRDAARAMRLRHVSSIVVVDANGRLEGIFTERDALFRVIAEGRDPSTTVLAQVMTRRPQTVHPDRPVTVALGIMHRGGFRHVPVVENGRVIGMVSARDALGSELEDMEYETFVDEQSTNVLA